MPFVSYVNASGIHCAMWYEHDKIRKRWTYLHAKAPAVDPKSKSNCIEQAMKLLLAKVDDYCSASKAGSR
jgi:hypothetical protein